MPRAGITLVELLVVLGVIGLILGMSVPALTGYVKQARLKTATRQVVGLLGLARSQAISSHADHAVVIDPELKEIRIVNQETEEPLDQKVRLPSEFTLELQSGGEPVPLMEVIFRPSGALAGKTVSLTLGHASRQHTIIVTGATGSVSVQQVEEGQ